MRNKFNINEILSEITKENYDFLVDAHCHIESDGYSDAERDYAIRYSIQRRIVLVTSPLTMPERYYALELRRKYSNWIYVTIGSHPLLNEPIKDVVAFIREHLSEIVGIGEVGLDFKPPNNVENVRKRQVEKFKIFIELAKELDKPIVVHSRSAGKYAIDILIKSDIGKVLMHSFSGKAKYAMVGVEMGYYFSIPPTVLFSPQKKRLVEKVPIENLMLESDAPALSFLNKELNWPWGIIAAAKAIAEIKEMEILDVIRITTKNAKEFFGIR